MAKIQQNTKDKLKDVVAPLPEMDKEVAAGQAPEVREADEKVQDAPTEELVEQAQTKDDSPIAIADTDITENKLKELKKKYKKIYVTDYVDSRYVWHRLNRKTFSDICDATEEIEDEDELIEERERRFCAACIVYPDADKVKENLDDDVMTSKVAREILYRSGFFPPTTKEV